MILVRSYRHTASIASITLALGSSLFAAPPERADESTGELLALYRTCELPLPPDGAGLVRFESGWRSVGGNGKETPLDYLGFLIKPATADRPAVALVGTREITLKSTRSKVIPVDPNPALAKDPTIKEADYLFGLNSNLAFALQCKSRGWVGLSQAILENRRVRVVIPPYGPGGGTLLPLRPSLAHTAWKHWENALLDDGTDRARIAERMKTLLSGEPSFTEWDRGVYASLLATLEPSKAKPGSVEAMVDDLVNLTHIGGLGTPRNPALVRLDLLGFDAVPALIDHWDDPRLTRAAYPRINNSDGVHVYVRDVVRPMIRDLAGSELDTSKAEIERADVLAWWKKAQQAGEEAYLVAHVLPADQQAEWANRTILRIIGRKYPRRLPEIYRTILEKRPRMYTHDVAEAIAESSLSPEMKLELFRGAVEEPDLERRRIGLWHLKKLDPTRFPALLIATIDSLPKTPRLPYCSCPEADIARLVSMTDDPRVWAALENAAKRADVGLRLEFLGRMTRSTMGRRLRLDFLSHFLDDDTVRDVASDPKRFGGPGAAFHFPRIAIRDFAAWKIGWVLEMDIEPDANWTPEQWTQFRARVRQELEHELSREPGGTVR
jgi:hypothetical protein